MENEDVGGWVQTATASQLAAFMGLAGARLIILLGAEGRDFEVFSGSGKNLDVRKAGGKLVSIGEAARITGMSRRWLYDHQALPFVRRLGRAIRVDVRALEAWLEAQR